MEKPDRPQTTIWRTYFARCITKATKTHSVYVTVIDFPQQRYLYERASVLGNTYTVCFCSKFSHLFNKVFQLNTLRKKINLNYI